MNYIEISDENYWNSWTNTFKQIYSDINPND